MKADCPSLTGYTIRVPGKIRNVPECSTDSWAAEGIPLQWYFKHRADLPGCLQNIGLVIMPMGKEIYSFGVRHIYSVAISVSHDSCRLDVYRVFK